MTPCRLILLSTLTHLTPCPPYINTYIDTYRSHLCGESVAGPRQGRPAGADLLRILSPAPRRQGGLPHMSVCINTTNAVDTPY